MPFHMSDHSSAVVTAKLNGREVLLTLGKAHGRYNYATQVT